jgi:hypothetical protein
VSTANNFSRSSIIRESKEPVYQSLAKALHPSFKQVGEARRDEVKKRNFGSGNQGAESSVFYHLVCLRRIQLLTTRERGFSRTSKRA